MEADGAGEQTVAAEAVRCDQGAPGAEGVGDAGGGEARGARADHDHVIAAGGRLAELRARLLRCGALSILLLPRRCHGPASFTATSAKQLRAVPPVPLTVHAVPAGHTADARCLPSRPGTRRRGTLLSPRRAA